MRARIHLLVTIPALLDATSEDVLEQVKEAYGLEELPVEVQEIARKDQAMGVEVGRPTCAKVDDWVYFGELMAERRNSMTVEEEVRDCFANLEGG
jgi:hypothetical protein